MSRAKRKNLTASEQHILEHARVVLLLKPEDCARCDELIYEHHYLHDATVVGEQLRYALVYKGEWHAVAIWAAAALHLKARDQFIGWSSEQCRRRRSLIANNARLLVLPDRHSPNLASRFMRLMLERISSDWNEHWKHPLALVETFVDPQLYRGTFTRPAAGPIWEKPRVGNATPAITTSNMISPSRFGCANWCGEPAANCVRPPFHPDGPALSPA